MNKELVVIVNNKVAKSQEGEFIVCGNGDYRIVFQFDSEWDSYDAKTALFVFNEKTVAVPFSGNVCDGIAIEDSNTLAIGVYAGNLVTTTPAYIPCLQSIRDVANLPSAPDTDVYDRLMALLNEYINKTLSIPNGGTKGQMLSKASDDDYDTEWVDAASEDYVNAQLAKKIDREIYLSGGLRFYYESSAGTATMAGQYGAVDGVAIRKNGGRLAVNDPINDDDATTKKFVLEQIAKYDFIKIVDVRPETGLENRLYLVPKANASTNDLFEEWAWVNGKWEYFGTRTVEIDLDDYVTKNEFSERVESIEERVSNFEGYETQLSTGLFNVVPENVASQAKIAEIGGKSVLVNGVVQSAKPTAIEVVGTNLIPFPYVTPDGDKNGLNFTVNHDGSLTVTGVSTSSFSFVYTKNLVLEHGKTYYISSGVILSYKNAEGTTKYGETKLTWDNAYTFIQAYYYFAANKAFNVTYYPMVYEGDVAKPYSPYKKQTFTIPNELFTKYNGVGEGDPNNPSVYNRIEWRDDGKVYFVREGQIKNNAWVKQSAQDIFDISDIINFSNLVEVEAGGRVSTVNQYGYAVPIAMQYQGELYTIINKKLDRSNGINGKTVVYAVNSVAKQETIPLIGAWYDGESIPRRTKDGQIVINYPANQYHAANQGYVDAKCVEITCDLSSFSWTNAGQVGADASTDIAWTIPQSTLGIKSGAKAIAWALTNMGHPYHSGVSVAGTYASGQTNGGIVQLTSDGNLTIVNGSNPASEAWIHARFVVFY